MSAEKALLVVEARASADLAARLDAAGAAVSKVLVPCARCALGDRNGADERWYCWKWHGIVGPDDACTRGRPERRAR